MRPLASVCLAFVLTCARATAQPNLISLDVRDAPLGDVIYMLAVQSGKNIVADASARRNRVTLHVRDFTFDAVLALLARLRDLNVRREGRVYVISSAAAWPGHAGNAAAPRLSVSAPPHPRAHIRLDILIADVQLLPDQATSVVQDFGDVQAAAPVADGTPFAFTKSTRAVDAAVADLATAGRLTILAASTLLALSDRETGLVIGQQYPAVLRDARSTTQRVQLVDVGLRLRVKSSVDRNGDLTTALRPQFTAVDDAGGGATPTLGRIFDATLRVSKDETIVLGGLFGDIDARTVKKLPFLGDIAVLGAIFRARRHGRPQDEILFLITPHVLESAPSRPHIQRGSRSR